MSTLPLSRRSVLVRAWPLIFSNAAIPLAGMADTFVLGASGVAADLGGVALGGALFSVFYWSFYFLRMGTTGLASQAEGAGDVAESQRTMVRALLLGLAIGLLLFLARDLLAWGGFSILQGEADVEETGRIYFEIRAWGTPAALAAFAISGWLIGLGRTGSTLLIYVVFSLVNIGLDLLFVLGMGYGPGGVAAATAIAEWVATGLALYLAWRALRSQGGWAEGALDRAALLAPAAMRRLFDVNVNLMIRTWCLVIGFTWFANAGARQGTDLLAGNHVLLQIITLWAFVLDAFAFVAEAESGRAVGRKSLPDLRRAARLTGEPMFVSGAVFAIVSLIAGPPVLTALIADEGARAAAIAFLPYCAAVPFLGAAAWLMDGVFIGATSGVILRNAGLISVAIYLVADFALSGLGNHGVWIAFLVFYVARAAALGVHWPVLEKRLASPAAG